MRFKALLTILILLHCAGQIFAQPEQHTYRFYKNLSVAEPECGPDLFTSKAPGGCEANASPGGYLDDRLPCGVQRTVYHTNQHWGLGYPNNEGIVGASYTVQMYFKITEFSALKKWSRIIDFSNGTLDAGIYFGSDRNSETKCLEFYDNGYVGECPFFRKNTYYLMTFTRNSQTGIMDIYVNDKLFGTFNDSKGKYVGKAGVPIYLFRDDAEVECESGAADLAYLSFNNRYASKEDVEYSFQEVCFIANVNAYADFSISPNPSCGYPKNITVKYTGPIKAPGTGYSFQWEWGGARVISGSGMGPYVVSWDTGGLKEVALTVRSNGCGVPLYNRKQAIIDSVDVNANVQSGSCETGENGTVTLRGLQGLPPYLYSLDSTNYQPDSIFQLGVGAHRVWVKDGNGCAIGKTIRVEFQSDLNMRSVGDTLICFGESVTLATTGNAIQYNWLPAAGLDNAAAKDPVATPEVSTSYIVTATKGFCNQTDTVNIDVAPRVEVKVTPDSEVDYNVPFQLYASSPQITNISNESFVWSPATGLNKMNSPSPVAILQENQGYTVEVTSEQGCKGSGSVNLVVRQRENINIPTAFTPDGDGKNEVLMPILSRMQSLSYFKVYNRWGQLVFFTKEMNAGWDGRFKGALPLTGTYAWEVEGITESGKTIRRKGTVTLLK